MPAEPRQTKTPRIFLAILGVGALVFALLLVDAFHFRPGGGDRVLSAAFAIIYDVLMVWTVLVVLTAMAAIQGEMPPAGWGAAILALPASGAATVAAIDLASRGGRWALAVPCLLPPLIAAYAAWARFPRLRAAAPAGAATLGAWGAVAAVSAIVAWAAM